MASSHLPPSPVLGTTSSSSSDPRYTPVSNGSDETNPSTSQPMRTPRGPLRLQTNFDVAESGSHVSDADYRGYSGSYPGEHKMPRVSAAPKYTVAEEKEVVRLFDWKLVPFLALLYLLSFLDRSNIGNAKIAGLDQDLHLSSSQYEWVLTAFYITYILFEWMTLMYRVVPPHIYISLCVCGWGLIASFQCLVTSFGGLFALRALLGITEAAFGPGVPFYLSLFYRREELAFRNGLFISAAPLATSFASSLAWLIVKLSSNGPISPWRILFLLEGFPSVIVAVFAWGLIPDSPGRARFLTRRQRTVAQLRLGENKDEFQGPQTAFDWQAVGKTLSDPKAYLAAFMFFSCNVAFSSMPVFLPTIIRHMGYSSLAAQALSAPPYLVAFIVVLITAYVSDRNQSRSFYLIMHALISSASYLAIALTGALHSYMPISVHTFIRYICVYPAVSGFFSAITLIITWTMDNRVEKEGKGASIAILNVIGQCGPLLGTHLYPGSDGPWYVPGMAVCSFFMVVVAVLATILRIILKKQNRILRLKYEASHHVSGGPVDDDEDEERDGLMGGGRREDLVHSTGEKNYLYLI